MKKELVEVRNLESFICQANARIYVDSNMILTPGAKDELSKKKITIVRDTTPDFTCCGAASCPARICNPAGTKESDADMERLLYGVAAMVKEEYGIEDPQQLQSISCKIVDTLKNSI